MLTGALIGAGIGIGVALISLLLGEPRRCPECGERLTTPWLRPLEECPHCENPLTDSRDGKEVALPRAAERRILVAAILLTVIGLGLFAAMIHATMESRRVWQYQKRQVETRTDEIRDLERRDDPASRARAKMLRGELRESGWNPETYREEFAQRAAIAGLGVVVAALGLGLLAVRLIARRTFPGRYDSEED